ncbi:MAG: glycosyltransferase [Saprospiraceae bacterium]
MSGILIAGYILLILYILSLLYITVYCLLQFHLFYAARQVIPQYPSVSDSQSSEKWPFVTIQLPVFNEQYVVGRLIDNIVCLDYPIDRFEIHILDDSTDETLKLSQQKADYFLNQGYNIRVFHRFDRTGYKAGALREALPEARGEFIAIFDADFLPDRNFLKQTIPHFSNPRTGVVQTRWDHINKDYSFITRLQALQLNVHFFIEQTGRQERNCFLQFNGTAGVWRKATIEDAGGWHADTLTEDLDLSYRAQLNGWKIKYLPDVGSPAELPAEMIGLKSQQFRWMKGGAENARKLLPKVWKSQLPLMQKIHATGHLLASSIFLFIFIAGTLSVPLVFLLRHIQFNPAILSISLVGMLSVAIIYYKANIPTQLQSERPFREVFRFLLLFPLFLALSMGLSLHNSVAVLEGYLGRKSAFVRTPKFNIRHIHDTFRNSRYQARRLPLTTVFEIIFGFYFSGAVIAALYTGTHAFLFFHILLAIGFTTIAWYTIRHLRLK